jgi:hypothetical protein
MEDENKVLIRTYVAEDVAKRFAAHAEEIGMGMATLLRVLVIRELRSYERNAAPAVVSTEEMIERL